MRLGKPSAARTIVEEHFAAHVIDNAIKRYPRVAEVYEGWKWRLSHDPDIGFPVPGSDPPAFVLHTFPWRLDGVPELRLLYTFDATSVHILSVEVIS